MRREALVVVLTHMACSPPRKTTETVARWLLLQVEMAERRDGPDGSLLAHTNFWEFHNFKEKERMSEGKEIREERNKIGQGFFAK